VGYPEALWGIGIDGVQEGSPAETAGVQAGDIVLGIDDLALDSLGDAETANDVLIQDMVDYVAQKAGQPVSVRIQRGIGSDAARLTLTITPQANEAGEGKMGVLIRPTPVRIRPVRASFLESLKYSAAEIVYTIQLTFVIPIQVLRGLISPEAARIVGPVGMAAMTGNAVQQSIDIGWAYPILHLAGLLNVAIGITNLLPIPAFDGGRIVFIVLEAIRGKPIPPEKESLVHGIGLMLLLLLFVVITIQDIFVPLPQGINWTDYMY
jgi:regulator of sigma E protease